MEWKLNFLESPMPVYYWAKLLCLAPFILENGRFYPATFLGKLYPIAIGTIHLISLPFKFFYSLEVEKEIDPRLIINPFPKHYMSMYLILNGMTVSFIPITFAFMKKDIIQLMNELREMSSELKTLGIMEVREKILKNISATTLMSNILVTIVTFGVGYLRLIRSIKEIFIYLLWNLINFNVLLIFSNILLCIKQRFTLVTEKLTGGLEADHDGESPTRNRLGDLERIEKVGTLHWKLCCQLDRTTKLFAICVTLSVLQSIATFIINGYWMYCGFINVTGVSNQEYLEFFMEHVVLAGVVGALVIFKLLVVLYACVSTCEQANAAKVTLFKVWTGMPTPHLNPELSMFSLQLMETPVTISPLGLIDLDYSLLSKTFFATVAHVIIVIQLGGSHENSEP